MEPKMLLLIELLLNPKQFEHGPGPAERRRAQTEPNMLTLLIELLLKPKDFEPGPGPAEREEQYQPPTIPNDISLCSACYWLLLQKHDF